MPPRSSIGTRRGATVSQAQIARALGVSQATVSMVLNGTGRVTLRTRRRVQQMVDRLHYRPNAHARTLRTARSRLVGVACGTPTDSFQALLLANLEAQLHLAGFQMLLHTLTGTPQEIQDRAMSFVDQRACGIIFQTPHRGLRAQMAQMFPQSFAMVTIGPMDEGAWTVGCDYDAAGRRVAEHLIALGRKRWATNITLAQYQAGIRLKTGAFLQAAADAGLAPPVEVTVDGDYYERHLQEHGQVVAEAVMRKHPDVDAFFFSCDDIALGALNWLQEAGYRVPEDVAVVGFNDVPAARSSGVPLTTIHQPSEQYAQVAVQMLDEQFQQEGQSRPRSQTLDCPLIIRKSTDPNAHRARGTAPPPQIRFSVEDQ